MLVTMLKYIYSDLMIVIFTKNEKNSIKGASRKNFTDEAKDVLKRILDSYHVNTMLRE